MRKVSKKKAYSISFFIYVTILFIGNALSFREDVVYYSRVGKVWGFPYSVHFQYFINSSEVIEGWYEKNLVYNFVIYVIIGLVLLLLVWLFNKSSSKGQTP